MDRMSNLHGPFGRLNYLGFSRSPVHELRVHSDGEESNSQRAKCQYAFAASEFRLAVAQFKLRVHTEGEDLKSQRADSRLLLAASAFLVSVAGSNRCGVLFPWKHLTTTRQSPWTAAHTPSITLPRLLFSR